MEIKKLAFFSLLLSCLVACGGGGGSSSPTPTPIPIDTTPEQVTFEAVIDVEFASLVESNQVQITGINEPTSIQITDGIGEYRINNDAYTSEAAEVSNEDLIQVRLTSGDNFGLSTVLTLDIGGITAEFSVTTVADLTAPVTTIEFPPNNALTSSETITIRGGAIDQVGNIVSLTIDDVPVTFDDGFATWQLEVPLDMGGQALVIVATDEFGNSTQSTLSITREAVDTTTPFPSAGITAREPSIIAFDESRNRLLLGGEQHGILSSIDLETGEQSVVIDSEAMEFLAPNNFLIRPGGNKMLVLNSEIDGSLLYEVDLDSLEQTVVYESDDNANVSVVNSRDVVFHPDDANQVFVIARTQIYQISLVGGGGEVLTTSGQSLEEAEMVSAVYDSTQGRILLLSGRQDGLNGLFSLSLSDNVITPLSTDLTNPNDAPLGRLFRLSIDPEDGVAHISDTQNQTLIGVSLTSGARETLFDSTPLGAFQIVIKALKVENFQYLFFIHAAITFDGTISTIRALDLDTGEDVIISRWAGESN